MWRTQNSQRTARRKFNSLHEAYAVALEELEEASVDFEETKTTFRCFWEDITASDDPTNDLIDAKYYTVEAIKELAQFAAMIDKTLETLEGMKIEDAKRENKDVGDAEVL